MPTLDTSFLIDLIRHKPKALEKVALFIEAGVPLATTCINILELYRGAFLSASLHDNLKEVEAIQNALIDLTIDDDTYEIFGALSAEQRKSGRPVGDFDELIASVTLCNDGIIITRDQHFLHVPGLKVETC
jgi:tRNA(fMet)-specific endonuclease VapC